jgi:hypothetical protein
VLGAGNGVEYECVRVWIFVRLRNVFLIIIFWEEDNTCVTKYFSHPRVDNLIQTLCRLRMTTFP